MKISTILLILDEISFGGWRKNFTDTQVFDENVGPGQDRRGIIPPLIRIRLKITPQERVDTPLEDDEDEEEENEAVYEVENEVEDVKDEDEDDD